MNELADVKIFPDGRMDVKNAAAYVGLSPKSMAVMRCHGDGPNFLKLGKSIFYRQGDLDAWISGRLVSSTAQYRAMRKAGGR